MDLSRKFSISQQVVAREVADETVILDLASGAYFGLDPVGAEIWRLLADGKSLGEVCDAIYEAYDVSRDELERDVAALTCDLEAKRLIEAV